jgi:colanic acid biosynthesis glycosyl transferase WcaI
LDILFLSQYFYPEQFLNNHLARALVDAGHQVNVVCCVPNYPEGKFFSGYSNRKKKRENWHGVVIHRVFTIARGRGPLQLMANYLTYPVTASWRIMQMGKHRGSISFVSMPSPLFQALAGIFAKKIWRMPAVYWVQDIWPDSAIITLGIKSPLIIKMLNGFCGWIYRQADVVMVQSDGFHDIIAGFGVQRDRIVTLPNPAPKMFSPVSLSAVPKRIRDIVPKDRPIMMFAGNIGESQDFDTLVAAAKIVPRSVPFLLVIIGSGRDEERVRALIEAENVGERFLFLGRHPEADMPAFFACADAMLVSLRNEPIFALTVPSKLQAYLACGKPIFAVLDGEGSAIIETAGAGMSARPGNPKAVAELFVKFSQMSTEELQAMGANARRMHEKHFSLSSVTRRLENELTEVLRSS